MIKRLLQFLFALSFCISASGQAVEMYNSIATAYVTTTISQNVVFNSTMQQGGTFTFSVLAHNGGGRAGQSDTANVKIEFYTSTGALVTSVNSTNSANLPNPNAVCGNPCIDPAVPWTNVTISSTLSAAQASTVAYARISMYGIDGSYWAGDYGPWYRAPTFTLNGGGNLAYNPEFGPYNGITAQGWTSTPGFGACQGAWGGSNACIVNSSGTPGTNTVGLVANQGGGGPSATGGTTSGQAGGYNNTMTTTSPSGAAAAPAAPAFDGTLTQTNNPSTQTITSGGSSAAGPSTAQQTSVNNWTTGPTGPFNNTLYIDQTGGYNNSVFVTQTGIRNRTDFSMNGNGNVVNHSQTGSNYMKEDIPGWGNNVTTVQSNTAGTHYAETKIQGNGNTVNHTQTGNASQVLFSSSQGDINSINTSQTGTASHYVEAKLIGNFHNVKVDQQGSTANKANVDLTNSGGAGNVDIQQLGGKAVTIIQSCANSAGCGTTIRQ